MKKTLILDIILCLFILLFFYTGISKLTAQDFFTLNLKQTLLKPYAGFFAVAVPAVEIIIGFILLISLLKQQSAFRKLGLYASAALMLVFTLFVGYMLKFWPSLPCTCGGVIRLMNWHQHLYFNSIFTILAIAGICLDKQLKKESPSLAFAKK